MHLQPQPQALFRGPIGSLAFGNNRSSGCDVRSSRYFQCPEDISIKNTYLDRQAHPRIATSPVPVTLGVWIAALQSQSQSHSQCELPGTSADRHVPQSRAYPPIARHIRKSQSRAHPPIARHNRRSQRHSHSHSHNRRSSRRRHNRRWPRRQCGSPGTTADRHVFQACSERPSSETFCPQRDSTFQGSNGGVTIY